MEVIVNIRKSDKVPAWQLKAWNEFLDMLIAEAEALLEKEKNTTSGRSK